MIQAGQFIEQPLVHVLTLELLQDVDPALDRFIPRAGDLIPEREAPGVVRGRLRIGVVIVFGLTDPLLLQADLGEFIEHSFSDRDQIIRGQQDLLRLFVLSVLLIGLGDHHEHADILDSGPVDA